MCGESSLAQNQNKSEPEPKRLGPTFRRLIATLQLRQLPLDGGVFLTENSNKRTNHQDGLWGKKNFEALATARPSLNLKHLHAKKRPRIATTALFTKRNSLENLDCKTRVQTGHKNPFQRIYIFPQMHCNLFVTGLFVSSKRQILPLSHYFSV